MACSRRETLRLQFFLQSGSLLDFDRQCDCDTTGFRRACYYAHVVPNSAGTYQPMLSYLRSIPDLQATKFQDALWQAYGGGEFIPYGGISAMPSMHVSIAVLLALIYTRYNKWIGLPFILFAILIQVGSVHLGWHYAIDGYVLFLTLLIWYCVSRYLRFLG
ncbi:MAG: phosphatase PAP2 family protein [Syntrophotaleaceae bacterium]